jgi:hypothetical protein
MATVVAQCAKAPGVHNYVAGSLLAVAPRYGTITTNALLGTKKKKKKKTTIKQYISLKTPHIVAGGMCPTSTALYFYGAYKKSLYVQARSRFRKYVISDKLWF